jgi:hypothetical protein
MPKMLPIPIHKKISLQESNMIKKQKMFLETTPHPKEKKKKKKKKKQHP